MDGDGGIARNVEALVSVSMDSEKQIAVIAEAVPYVSMGGLSKSARNVEAVASASMDVTEQCAENVEAAVYVSIPGSNKVAKIAMTLFVKYKIAQVKVTNLQTPKLSEDICEHSILTTPKL
jgi:hypothetical protein